MKCPYCQREMLRGYVQCQDGVYWTPTQQWASIASFSRKKVSLENGGSPSNTAVYAHRCEQCGVVIIPYGTTPKGE